MKPVLVAALLLCSHAVVSALLPVPDDLLALAEFVMREAPSREELHARADEVAFVIAAVETPAARELYEAMRQFLIGFGELGSGATGEAEDRFERAAAHALAANALQESSEGYRVLADAYNQLLDVRPPAYKIVNAGRARRAALRAVELDVGNPLAHVAAAAYFVSAPPIAGGGLDRARDHLREAARLSDGSNYVMFLVNVWEARLAVAAGRRGDATGSLALAHAIYPGNWWLVRVAGELGVGLPQ